MGTNINLNYLLKQCISNFKITFISAVLSLLITILLFLYSETRVVLKNSFYISKMLYIALLQDDPILMQFTSKDNEITNQNNTNQSIFFLKYTSAIKLTDILLDSYAAKIKFSVFAEKKKIFDIAKKKNYQVYFNNEQELQNDNLIQLELKKNFKEYDIKIPDDSDFLLINKEVKEIIFQIILDKVRTINKNFNQNLDNYILHTYTIKKIPFSYYKYISTYVFLLIFINFIIVSIKFRKKILI
jgi:hypothetical protein